LAGAGASGTEQGRRGRCDCEPVWAGDGKVCCELTWAYKGSQAQPENMDQMDAAHAATAGRCCHALPCS